MDDNCSMMSSLYWDTRSIQSDSTIRNECYQTPTGSFMDVSICDRSDTRELSESENITPKHSQEEICQENKCIEINATKETSSSVNFQTPSDAPTRPPPIKLGKSVSVNMDSRTLCPEKTNWRHSFTNRLPFRKTQIKKSTSVDANKSKSVRSILSRMRNSLKHLKSFNHSKTPGLSDKVESPSLNNDSSEINFERCSLQDTSSKANRNYQIDEDKSIFNLCSTITHVFNFEHNNESLRKLRSSFITDCVNIFLDNGAKQIESKLQFINQHLGCYFNLLSEKLEAIDKTMKYKVKEMPWSRGVCIITDTKSNQRYVALKRSPQRNWISFNSFLQHLDQDKEPLPDQTWICYEADSITNMNNECNRSSDPTTEYRQLILDSLLQLVNIIVATNTNEWRNDIKTSNVLLVSSNLSLICVFAKSSLSLDKDESALSHNNANNLHSMMSRYEEALKNLGTVVDRFLSHVDNCCYLIGASYPLDFLFYVLLRLHNYVSTPNDHDTWE